MKMEEVFIYNQDYLDIPLRDLPDTGSLIVCKDPQKRLKWSVVVAMSDNGGSPPKALGLFWEKEEAVFYANAKSTDSMWEDKSCDSHESENNGDER